MYKIPDKFRIIKQPGKVAGIFRKLRWKGQIACVHCGCVNDIKTHSISRSGIYRYFCENCRKTFSDTTGSIFSKSKIPLWKWLYVLIILFESTGSLSAAEVERAIHVSYKTALRMMRKIRSSLLLDRFEGELKGIVESDEAWISHKENQQILMGIVERKGAVKFFPILDRSDISVYFPHRKYVAEGSLVCTDGLASYNTLNSLFIHHSVNHSIGEFAWNDIHTNTIEGIWSMLKGIIRTIHHGVSKIHLLEYCQLFAFMYSNRFLNLNEKLNLLFQKLCQPRYCTY